MTGTSTCTRQRITVTGIVQGVGFRPFVYNLALLYDLSGFVRNVNGLVEIEVQGRGQGIADFLKALKDKPPALASIDRVDVVSVPTEPSQESFTILQSSKSSSLIDKLVPADTATCQDCLREIFDKDDRRFRYPFTNCINCGPRFTIIKSLPYDRPATTMDAFAMCECCQAEYKNPHDRRFHAQPNACPLCGPCLSFLKKTGETGGNEIKGNAQSLAAMVEALKHGAIVAMKSLGGFHLVCDGACELAVSTLRKRKGREFKPLALMMKDLAMVRRYCLVTEAEARQLEDKSRPIVLLAALPDNGLAPSVAPHMSRLGVMLPYTPLHHILMQDYGKPLVATSGNFSDEPIAIDNQEAKERLAKIADAFLLHDRDIETRYDDSVLRMSGWQRILMRRSRGLAPLPVKLPFSAQKCVLACGGHLKNTFCLINGDKAYVSQHIGDLDNLETLEHFEQSLAKYRALFDLNPALVACDMHPDYLSSSFALDFARDASLDCLQIQHHHAHIVSCMVENNLTDTVIGVAFDGIGYGADGTLWGGEFFLAGYADFERRGFFAPVPLPGGALAIKEPWRMALSYAFTSQSEDFYPYIDTQRSRLGDKAVDTVRMQMDKSINAPLTSSGGRLFDALASMLGLCHQARYEGQAAIELESLADESGLSLPALLSKGYSYKMLEDGVLSVIDGADILQQAYGDFVAGTAACIVAAKFHATMAHVILSVCLKIRDDSKINQICLSGGVFQNALLVSLVKSLLLAADFQVYFPDKLPANDGGLSLGQATIALARANALEKH